MIPAANLISLMCVLLYRTLTSIGNRKLFDQVHFSGYRVWKSLLITLQSVPYHYFELIGRFYWKRLWYPYMNTLPVEKFRYF